MSARTLSIITFVSPTSAPMSRAVKDRTGTPCRREACDLAAGRRRPPPGHEVDAEPMALESPDHPSELVGGLALRTHEHHRIDLAMPAPPRQRPPNPAAGPGHSVALLRQLPLGDLHCRRLERAGLLVEALEERGHVVGITTDEHLLGRPRSTPDHRRCPRADGPGSSEPATTSAGADHEADVETGERDGQQGDCGAERDQRLGDRPDRSHLGAAPASGRMPPAEVQGRTATARPRQARLPGLRRPAAAQPTTRRAPDPCPAAASRHRVSRHMGAHVSSGGRGARDPRRAPLTSPDRRGLGIGAVRHPRPNRSRRSMTVMRPTPFYPAARPPILDSSAFWHSRNVR